MITYDGEVIPNGEITISADVYNNGSENIKQLDVEIIAPNGNVVQTSTIDKELLVGEKQTLEIP